MAADLNTLRTRLSEAENALHDLMVNQREVRCTGGDGRSVEYTPATANDLRRYIAEMKDAIAAASGQRRRLMRFSF